MIRLCLILAVFFYVDVAIAEIDSRDFTSTLSTLKSAKFELRGELELEYVDTENDAGIQKPNPHFQIDTFYLYPRIYFPDENLALKAELAYKTSQTYIEELYVAYENLPGNSWIQVGLDDLFIAKYDRKSEAEVLAETAFYRNDDLGIQAGGAPLEQFYWRLSLSNGFALATKGPSEDSGYPVIHDGRNTGDSGGIYAGAGLGFKMETKIFKADVLPFYYEGSLSDTDIEFLQTIDGYGTSLADTKSRFGSNVRFDVAGLTLVAQWIQAEDGDLKRDSWFIQPSFAFSKSYELVYRFMDLNVDIDPVFTNSLTWNRKQHVFSLVWSISKYLKMKTEYYINNEETSLAEVDNDEFMVQYELKF